MDGNLFARRLKVLQHKKNEKQELIDYIQEKTGILLISEEISITTKKITITTSSVKKVMLKKNAIHSLLQEKGYFLQY